MWRLDALGIASAALGAGCGLWPSEGTGWSGTRALAGTYVLVSINDSSAAGPPGPLAACPQPPSLGELILSGPSGEAGPLQAGPLYSLQIQTNPATAPTVRDAGDWSLRDDRAVFTSSPAYGRGAYTGEVVRDPGGGARVSVTFGGDRFTFQRVRLSEESQTWGSIRLTSVDSAGAVVPGLFARFRAPDGIESPGVAAYQQGFSTGGPAGTWYISLTPPAGYRLAAAQPEHLCLAVHAGGESLLQVVIRPLAP